jgi:hypothetical protein
MTTIGLRRARPATAGAAFLKQTAGSRGYEQAGGFGLNRVALELRGEDLFR